MKNRPIQDYTMMRLRSNKSNKFWWFCLVVACLSAAMLGYALGGQIETSEPSESLRTPEAVTDYETVQEYGVEAQGTYLSYEEYEAHVAEQINDRSAEALGLLEGEQ